MRKRRSNAKIKCNKYEFVHKVRRHKEYWWIILVKTTTKVRHNNQGLSEWDNQQRTHKSIEVSCPAEIKLIPKIRPC